MSVFDFPLVATTIYCCSGVCCNVVAVSVVVVVVAAAVTAAVISIVESAAATNADCCVVGEVEDNGDFSELLLWLDKLSPQCCCSLWSLETLILLLSVEFRSSAREDVEATLTVTAVLECGVLAIEAMLLSSPSEQ